MTSGHRHATDRQKTLVVSECPEGCQAYELETSGDKEAVDKLVEKVKMAYDTYRECGSDMGIVRQDEPVEELD